MNIKSYFSWNLIVMIMITLSVFSCNESKKGQDESYTDLEEKAPFTVAKNTWKLPVSLDEISGVCWYQENVLACINDEQGIIFLYHLEERKVVDSFNFGRSGDYEGITYQRPFFYVIKSNGRLFKYNEMNGEVLEFDLPFNSKNDLEGICIENDSSLLIALKGRGGIDGKKKKYKAVYRLSTQNTEQIELVYKLPFIDKEGPSGVVLDHITNRLWLLSHSSRELYNINAKSGEINEVIELDKKLFPQAEGICISPDGRIFISNERANRYQATILEF